MQEIMAPNNLVGLEVDVAIYVKPEGQTDGEVGCIGQDSIIGQAGGVKQEEHLSEMSDSAQNDLGCILNDKLICLRLKRNFK